MKYCPRCKDTKPKSAFSKSAKAKAGLARYCKACVSRRRRELYTPEWVRDRKPMCFYKDLDEQGLKYCSYCTLTKNKSEFTKRIASTSGLEVYCKSCNSLQSRQRKRQS